MLFSNLELILKCLNLSVSPLGAEQSFLYVRVDGSLVGHPPSRKQTDGDKSCFSWYRYIDLYAPAFKPVTVNTLARMCRYSLFAKMQLNLGIYRK